MHLIDGRPALFIGGQICYANGVIRQSQLEKSLYQIKKNIRLTQKYRQQHGWKTDFDDYGWLRFYTFC